MNTINQRGSATRLVDALRSGDPSQRLRAVLAAGTQADPYTTNMLVAQCRVEPDFYVRDMLTWALCRRPADEVVPLLITELDSTTATAQARSQALHTLSKLGDRRAWPAVRARLHDVDDDVARSAWRAAVVVVPPDETVSLAAELVGELGRGDGATKRSLSRAFVALAEPGHTALGDTHTHPNPEARAHAAATATLFAAPDADFAFSLDVAARVAATGGSTGEC